MKETEISKPDTPYFAFVSQTLLTVPAYQKLSKCFNSQGGGHKRLPRDGDIEWRDGRRSWWLIQ